MKAIRIKTLATGIVATMILFSGCKKTDNTGPAGPQGPSGLVTVYSDGFIKGNVSGTHRDGTAFNETFNYTNYWNGSAGTLDSASFGYSFYMKRATDVFANNSSTLNISTTSLTSFSSAFGSLSFSFTKSMGANKLFEFYLTGSSSVTPTLSGVSYNSSTGVLSGSFNVTLSPSQNNTGKTATISGTFQSTITQLYYFKKKTGGPSNQITNSTN
jgi:hypothetical protein